MSRFGPLQLPSVLAYAGLVTFVFALFSVFAAPRWFGFSKRFQAPLAGTIIAAVLFGAGLYWPARAFTASPSVTRLDAFMPEYSFYERHEITIHAAPDRVRTALNQVSFADLGVMETLGRVRNLVVGGGRPAALAPTPILETVRGGRTGFFLLDDTPGEFVFGLAGQPWNNTGVRLTRDEFRTWSEPGNIKVAANLLIEDAGQGRSRLITETRIAASDSSSRSRMGKYWTLVYPGSGLIRRSLLEAVRTRAERS